MKRISKRRKRNEKRQICGLCKHYRGKSSDDGYCTYNGYYSDMVVDYDRDYKCGYFEEK